MALEREREVRQQGTLLVSQYSSSSFPDAAFYSNPGDRFLEAFTEWADNPVDIVYPNGRTRRIEPTEWKMEHRYDVVLSTFTRSVLTSDIRGTYGEIMGGVLLHNMVQEVTRGAYTVIPTLPQLDVDGRRDIPGCDERDKTADVMLGRVVQGAFEPCMMFDLKASPRGDRKDATLGVGVNYGLGLYIPVGIVYIGDLPFTDAKGNEHTTASYLENVVHPAVLDNTLSWHTLWPKGVRRNPQQDIFAALSKEVLTACAHTRQKIREYDWDDKTRAVLLERIMRAEKVFTRVQELSTKSSHSAA